MNGQDDLNTPVIAVVGLIGTILVFAIVVLLTAVFYRVEARQQYEKDISRPPAQLGTLTADQRGRLASYGWVDEEKQIAFIPISRAMELVVGEISGDPEAASPEVLPPEEEAKEEDDAS